ncbi:hypothetical protein DWUX_2077 [Desulfovibrio diazotrophicus]|nr:hypothetical protein DWUX_2077 [Desulfovibrio diazotrophicus]
MFTKIPASAASILQNLFPSDSARSAPLCRILVLQGRAMLPQGHAGPSALRFFLSASCNNPVVLNFLLHLGFSVFFLSPGFTPLFFRTKQDKHSPE